MGQRVHRSSLSSRLSMGARYPIQVDEAGRLVFRRNQKRVGRLMAGPHQRPGRYSHAVSPCDRRRPNHPAGLRIEGVSFAYTFDKANATAPSTHHSQYFEMFGDMGMYHDGWIASTDPFAIPWLLLLNKPVEYVWCKATLHLYHVTPDDDWTQYTDVKQKYPDKLKELQHLFVAEAPKNNIFPLNNSPLVLNPRTS